jgi:hypothetical protein
MGVSMRRFISRLLVFAVLGTICTASLVSAAQDDPQVKAREFYQQGKDLYEAGKFTESLAAFQTAYDAKPHPVVLKSIAECQFQLLDVKAAIATLEKYLADPGPTDKPELEQRLAVFRQALPSVEATSEPTGAGLTVDGSVTDQVTPATIELNPGDHEVAFNLEGYEPLVKTITLANGEAGQLAVDFSAEGVSTEAGGGSLIDPFGEEGGDEESETEFEDEVETDGPPTAFWIAAAVAGVGLISGTVFGTMALGDEDDYQKTPTDDIKTSGERNAIIADVSFGVAAAAAIVGAVILITDNSGGEVEAAADMAKARFNVQPIATDNLVGVSTSVLF